jgi:hypothetical protein
LPMLIPTKVMISRSVTLPPLHPAQVTLGQGGTLQLLGIGSAPAATGASGTTTNAAQTTTTTAVRTPGVQPQGGEHYSFTVPPLVLLDPLSPSCVPGLRGDLVVKCDSTGLVTVLTLGDEGDVEGTIERIHTSGSVTSTGAGSHVRLARVHGNLLTSVIAEVLGSDAMSPSTSQPGGETLPSGRTSHPGPRHYPLLVPVSAATGGIHHTAVLAGTTSRGGAQGPAPSSSQAVGTRAGLRGQQAPPPAQLLTKMDLSSLCALRLPRLWAAVVDAVMYNSAEAASGKVGWWDCGEGGNAFEPGHQDPCQSSSCKPHDAWYGVNSSLPPTDSSVNWAMPVRQM